MTVLESQLDPYDKIPTYEKRKKKRKEKNMNMWTTLFVVYVYIHVRLLTRKYVSAYLYKRGLPL